MSRPASTAAAERGFTLVELLIVIAILGVLAAVLIPQLGGATDAAAQKATEGDMLQLETGVNTFSRKQGIFPPDDLKPFEPNQKVAWKSDNGRNTGIESLVCFLSQSLRDGVDLTNVQQLTNTDGDDHGAPLPLLHRNERVEVADGWKTPLAYFSKHGMDKAQAVLPASDVDLVQVKAKRRANGTPYGAGKFQLLSAGKDLTFGTDDDVVWPPD